MSDTTASSSPATSSPFSRRSTNVAEPFCSCSVLACVWRSGLEVSGSGFEVSGSGFQDVGCGVQGEGCRVWGLRCRVSAEHERRGTLLLLQRSGLCLGLRI